MKILVYVNSDKTDFPYLIPLIEKALMVMTRTTNAF